MGILEQLLEAINNLNATLVAMSNAAPANTDADAGDEPEEEQAPPPKKTGKKAKSAPAAEAVSVDDVRAVLKELIDAGKNDLVKKLIKDAGATKLTDVAEGKLSALKSAAEAALAEGDDDLL